jgi:hypothetical protein
MCDSRPKCNEWRKCKHVQKRMSKCSWWRAKWLAMCSEWWSCWKCWKKCERQFTISEISCDLPQISRNLLYEIVEVRVGYHRVCARWVQKMLTGVHKKQIMASTLTSLGWYHKNGDKFRKHIVRVTVDETWVSFVNVETTGKECWWWNSCNKRSQ